MSIQVSASDYILAATNNKNKLAELSAVAERFSLKLVSIEEHSKNFGLKIPPDVEEVGQTFLENAKIKAETLCRWGNCITLGDDSGLEVDALQKRPGIMSARYAGEGATDADRINKVLSELEEVFKKTGNQDRTARFCCALFLKWPTGASLSAESHLEGAILHEARGSNGFGYDPIVYLNALGKTLAEVDFDTICRRGFRAIAAEKLFKLYANRRLYLPIPSSLL